VIVATGGNFKVHCRDYLTVNVRRGHEACKASVIGRTGKVQILGFLGFIIFVQFFRDYIFNFTF